MEDSEFNKNDPEDEEEILVAFSIDEVRLKINEDNKLKAHEFSKRNQNTILSASKEWFNHQRERIFEEIYRSIEIGKRQATMKFHQPHNGLFLEIIGYLWKGLPESQEICRQIDALGGKPENYEYYVTNTGYTPEDAQDLFKKFIESKIPGLRVYDLKISDFYGIRECILNLEIHW